ncbi:TraR/DksA family transcriptional regulator [Nocardioides marmoraquaticus]
MSEGPYAALLAEERLHASRAVASLGADLEGIVAGADLTATDDEHDPEGHTIAFERSQTSALLAGARQRLAEVDAALARLGDGTYGRCERCGEPIPEARLLARPSARTCVPCAAR